MKSWDCTMALYLKTQEGAVIPATATELFILFSRAKEKTFETTKWYCIEPNHTFMQGEGVAWKSLTLSIFSLHSTICTGCDETETYHMEFKLPFITEKETEKDKSWITTNGFTTGWTQWTHDLTLTCLPFCYTQDLYTWNRKSY